MNVDQVGNDDCPLGTVSSCIVDKQEVVREPFGDSSSRSRNGLLRNCPRRIPDSGRMVGKPETIQRRASGNWASDRFPSKGCKEAHYPHTCASAKQVFIGVSVKGCMIGRKSDYRFFESEYPWTPDTEFAHQIELNGSMSIQCSWSTNGIVRACHLAATSIAANGCLQFMYTQRAL